MRDVVRLVVPGLLLIASAAGGDSSGCTVSKGLYDSWLALAKHGSVHPAKGEALVEGLPSVAVEPDKRREISKEYRAFFQCVADAAERQKLEVLQFRCEQAEGDRLASLVCRTATYLKRGRGDARELTDALPAGKKAAELVWDLQEVAGGWPDQSGSGGVFLPHGPAFKLIDELFLLVLDDKETAAAKYFTIAAFSSGAGARHIDEQMKLMLREAPSVVVKQWMILRQYQPRLKKLLAEMTASLPPAELQKMRQELGAFCSKDNPDCPEITKLFGRPE